MSEAFLSVSMDNFDSGTIELNIESPINEVEIKINGNSFYISSLPAGKTSNNLDLKLLVRGE